MKLLNRLYFKYCRFEHKLKKLLEFWQMYLKWCKYFDHETDKAYKDET